MMALEIAKNMTVKNYINQNLAARDSLEEKLIVMT
jgi:hypothetical protein